MAGDKILQKIEEEAKQEAAAIQSAAAEKAQKEREKILGAAKAQAAEIAAKAEKDAAEAASRQQLVAELENRKNTLRSEREVLSEAFQKAAEKVAALSGKDWEDLIVRTVLSADIAGTEKLVVPAKDRPLYEKGLLEKINGALKQQGKPGKLTLSDKNAAFDGGVLLEGDDCDYDGSFATLLEDVRTGEEYQVARILFGPEVK